ncbi:immunity 52 family protein (plasmid) [Xanthomonas citri pv. citri]|nr:immunity 52 family protein [Xanthomonas citri pv. citri]QRD67239.1 immunity 52 family protein [Xanthomonas citri pv. citri]QRD71833.1 immunity 52 family protein [Xanthomonas citri pv. citri]
MPDIGRATISIYKPDHKFQAPYDVVLGTLKAFVESGAGTEFAFVNVYDRVDGALQYYRPSYATFPHRQCLGWMCYVPKAVSKEQLPLAADVIQIKSGTIVVAVAETFDMTNREHIKRANQIEMDMNDLGLLAVLDPSL